MHKRLDLGSFTDAVARIGGGLQFEEIFQRTLDSNLLLFTISDRKGSPVYLSPSAAAMTGYPLDERANTEPAAWYYLQDTQPLSHMDWIHAVLATQDRGWVDYRKTLHSRDNSEMHLIGSACAVEGFVCSIELDVSAQKRAEEALMEEGARLQASLLRLRLVHSISRQLASCRDIGTLLDSVVKMIRSTFGYYATSICLIEGDKLVCKAGAGGNPAWKPIGEWINIEQGVMGATLRTGRSRLAVDVAKDPDFLLHPSLPETKSELAVPLFGTRGPLGIINIEADQPNAFDEQDRIAMEALADLLGVAIENTWLYQELRTDNARLQELDRIKTEFVSMIGHDIKNPLTVMRGYAELIETTPGATADIVQCGQRILAEAEEVTQMSEQMLELFRHEAVGVSYCFDAVPIRDVLEKVLPLADENHPIRIDIEQDVPAVSADRRSLIQVLRNLVTNAIKYSPDGGAVALSARREDEDRVRLAVADIGVGIAVEDLPRLFNKFQRIWNEKTEAVRGTGLGLYICRKIIEDHHGSIGVESSPGTGSTFSILLPAARDQV